MRYEIKGDTLPVIICYLEKDETIVCESGAMSWMSENMKMETTTNGGIGKMFGRMVSGENLLQNRYVSKGGSGYIAFASSFPGSIIPVEIEPGKEIIAQKSAFLAATPGVELSVHFKKKIGTGLFGGEGFIMEKISGKGLAFIEIDGSVIEYQLEKSEKIVLDTGHLAMMDSTCKMDIQTVPGIKNKFLGGEGLFNTVVSGPGRVLVQTMPIANVAGIISSHLPTNN